jgi:16S rRNA (cytidine1402-2'-O)-methyltransferase
MGILYIVATPIGNLKDITFRALAVLKGADLILAEDTRMAEKLLSHYEIHKPIKRYDENVRVQIYCEVADRLRKGEMIALVSDAGTPAISDPGARLVSFVREKVTSAKIVPIPGPSALTAALSATGLNADQFTFVGYPPHKKGRQKFFNQLKEIKARPIVLYESPHRFQKTLDALLQVFGDNHQIVICRELTKIYEEIFKGNIAKVREYFVEEKIRGEFVLIVS